MADQKITMPSGMGGIVRYSDETKSKVLFSPKLVIVFIVVIIALEIILHYAL